MLVRPTGRTARDRRRARRAVVRARARRARARACRRSSSRVSTLTPARLVRRRRPGPRTARRLWQMALVLVLVGLLLTLAVEFFVVRNIDIGRTNTVFKIYLQVWVLWAPRSAAWLLRRCTSSCRACPRLAARLARRVRRAARRSRCSTRSCDPAKIDDASTRRSGRTLDGTAFMDEAVLADRERQIPLAHDREAIAGCCTTSEGLAGVAEVNTSPTLYGWGNRYAMFTGNPAIVGWDYHQRQQRGARRRARDEPDRGRAEGVRDCRPGRGVRDPRALRRRTSSSARSSARTSRTATRSGPRAAAGTGTLVYDRDPGVSILELRSEEDPGAEASR